MSNQEILYFFKLPLEIGWPLVYLSVSTFSNRTRCVTFMYLPLKLLSLCPHSSRAGSLRSNFLKKFSFLKLSFSFILLSKCNWRFRKLDLMGSYIVITCTLEYDHESKYSSSRPAAKSHRLYLFGHKILALAREGGPRSVFLLTWFLTGPILDLVKLD